MFVFVGRVFSDECRVDDADCRKPSSCITAFKVVKKHPFGRFFLVETQSHGPVRLVARANDP